MPENDYDCVHPSSPAFSGGAGGFTSGRGTGRDPEMDKWNHPGPLDTSKTKAKLTIHGTIVAGGELSSSTIVAVNKAAASTPKQWRRYIAYATTVKVGGSLAWRANNPGNLRGAESKIGSVPGAAGKFAVFATLDAGRAAQRALYLSTYGDMKVRDAINKLTPSSENDTEKYLADLKKAGVDLDKDVKSQIDTLMKAVQTNEGLIEGKEVDRVP